MPNPYPPSRSLEPTFVEFIPQTLNAGLLYISMEHGAVAHLCACGCGSKVDTPLTPTDWNLRYDGESITLRPSVGSWSLPCRSHYLITDNSVRWAGAWSEERIRSGREADRKNKQKHYAESGDASPPDASILDQEQNSPSVWRRLKEWWRW